MKLVIIDEYEALFVKSSIQEYPFDICVPQPVTINLVDCVRSTCLNQNNVYKI